MAVWPAFSYLQSVKRNLHRMVRLPLLLAGLCFFGLLPAQDSLLMKTVGHWDDNSLPLRFGAAYSDCWGWTDANGNEYAMIGSIEHVWFFKINADGSLTYADTITPGTQSLWRDIKTYSHYAYCVADEHAEGLVIVDLQYLPDSVHRVQQTTAFFSRSHNIFIDEGAARLYAAGSVSASGNLVILDLSNPENPVLLGAPALNGGYVHDLYVRGDTAWCNHGNNGLYVYDLSNPTNAVLLGVLNSYPEQGYNHACWLDDTGNWLVFTDETHGRGVKMTDVSDPSNMSVTDVFRSALLAPAHTNSIAHNPIIRGDSVYLSYYHDGIQVFDLSDPYNVVRVAYYDTEPNNTNYNGYQGAWGVYPLLPSGRILGSDELNGLFVLELMDPIMPVELVAFDGRAEAGGYRLFWETASESNSDGFELQYSADGRRFGRVGRVAAAGFSAATRHYEWPELLPGGYYRLRMQDRDGTWSHSPVIYLPPFGKQGLLEVTPNLLAANAAQTVRLHLPKGTSGKIRLRLVDAGGRTIWQADREAQDEAIPLTLPPLPAGVYALELAGRGQVVVAQLVVR